MEEPYKVPSKTTIRHVHLKVSDLDRSLAFYVDLFGFELTSMMGDQAAFISAGGYHRHIGLNIWRSAGMPPASVQGVGLFHVAILYSTRKGFAVILKRLIDQKYPLIGAADHGVSEAIYLNDPDGNGIELYRDRPREEWGYGTTGRLGKYLAVVGI